MKTRLRNKIISMILVACMVFNVFGGFATEGKKVEAADKEYAVHMIVGGDYSRVQLPLGTVLQAGTYTVEMEYYAKTAANFQVRLCGGSEANGDTLSGANITELEKWHTYTSSVTASGAVDTFRIYGWPSLDAYFKGMVVKDANGTVVVEVALNTETVADYYQGNIANSYEIVEAPVEAPVETPDNTEYAVHMIVGGDYSRVQLPLGTVLQAGTYTVEMEYYAKTAANFQVRLCGGSEANGDTLSGANITELEKWHTYTSSMTASGAVDTFRIYGWPSLDAYFKGMVVKDANGTVVVEVALNAETVVDYYQGNTANSYEIVEAPVEAPAEEPTETEYAVNLIVGGDYSRVQLPLGTVLQAGTYTVEMEYYAKTAANFQVRLCGGSEANGDTLSGANITELEKWHTYTSSVTASGAVDTFRIYGWPSLDAYFKGMVVKDANGTVVVEVALNAETVVDYYQGNIANSYAIVEAPIEGAEAECEHEYASVVTEPTCTEGGHTTYTCPKCDDSYVADETEALGHNYEAVYTPPTATELGYTTYTCSRCGDNYVEKDEPLKEETGEDRALYIENDSDGYYAWNVELTNTLKKNTEYNVSFDYFLDEYEMTGSYIALQPRLNWESIDLGVVTDTTLGKWHTFTNSVVTTDSTREISFFVWPTVKAHINNIVVKDAEGNIVSTAYITENTVVVDKGGAGSGSYELEADIPVEDTTVYAYKITANKNNSSLEQNTWFMTTWAESGKKVVFEMDYYLEGGNDTARVFNVANGVGLADDKTGVSELALGVNHYKGTFTGDGEGLHFGVSMRNSDDAILYVWNVKVYIDGIEQEVFAKEEVVKIGTLKKVIVKYDDIVFKPVDDGKLKEETGADRALYLENTSDGFYAWSIELSNKLNKNTEYTVSFDYFLDEYEMTGGYIALQPRLNWESIDLEIAQDVKLGKWYKYNDSMVITESTKEIHFFVWPSIKAHIDNIVIKDSKGNIVSTAYITENTVVTDKGGAGKGTYKLEADIPVEDKTVYAYKITANKNNNKPEQNVWFMTTWPEKGQKVVFEMDYYLEGGDETARVCNIATGANLPNNLTGYADLDLGKNHYKGTFRGTGGGLHFGISMKSSDDAVLYVWNVKVYIDGVEQEVFAKEEVVKTGTLKTVVMKYKDIVFKPVPVPDPNHPANIDNNPGGKLMLKQENYKNREEYGVLAYQGFIQYVGADRNGSVVKENTTYVFSFDYYADPGLFGQGVGSANAVWKSLHTGHNDEITGANQHLLWNADENRYSGYTLPSSGRHHIEIEYTTLPGQTDFIVGLESGWDGDAYYWNFQLVEKDGDGTNLLYHTDFEGPFSSMCTDAADSGSKRKTYWRVSDQSADAMGTYTFVPFDEAIAALGEGEVLQVATNEVEKPKVEETVEVPEVKEGPETGIIVAAVAAVIALGGGAAFWVTSKKKKKEEAA